MTPPRAVMIVVAAGSFAFTAPPSAMAKVKAREAYLYKSGNACDHDVDTGGYTLRKKRDIAVWDVSNQGRDDGSRPCGAYQYVILCSYKKVDKQYVLDKDVFETCQTTPAGIATGMNAVFKLEADKRVWFNCQAKGTNIKARVLFDSGGTEPTCAGRISVKRKKSDDGGDSFRYHVIDIEIVP